jgi:hypothetical protein
MKLFDLVALTEPLPAEGFEVGDIGVIVHEHYKDGEIVAYELEIVDILGNMLDVVSVHVGQVKSVEDGYVMQARPFSSHQPEIAA